MSGVLAIARADARPTDPALLQTMMAALAPQHSSFLQSVINRPKR